jgi:hypothetical protein
VFRSDAQLARVCRALCADVGLAHLWTDDGPSDEAIGLRDAGGGPLSSGERIMVLAAWDVWNSHGSTNLGDVVHRLDGRRLATIGTLLVAVAGGMHAIDAWLAKRNLETSGHA